ncbi:hypothetical protein [Riemerella anatipestifer]|uniref:hypothetical protein n=1 Tax=Riemerella anatipestifer TaxID=34085 RepID=UPI0023634964|nr:hypothetical protein [Riemerella anatipestifer]MDD1523794.1 hypothetical protein [Riemerella anatipestifer]
MSAIGVGTAGIGTLWGLLIVKFLQKTITFNISIHSNYQSIIINIEDRTNNIAKEYNEFLSAYKRKLLYNVVLFTFFFLGFLSGFSIDDNEARLFFKIFFGVLTILISIQFLYFKIAKKSIDEKIREQLINQ